MQLEALAEYQAVRDPLSLPMFDVVERIAAYDWDMAEIPTLLKALASTMVDELELLAAIPAAA